MLRCGCFNSSIHQSEHDGSFKRRLNTLESVHGLNVFSISAYHVQNISLMLLSCVLSRFIFVKTRHLKEEITLLKWSAVPVLLHHIHAPPCLASVTSFLLVAFLSMQVLIHYNTV